MPQVDSVGEIMQIVNSALATAWALRGEVRVRALVSCGGLALKVIELGSLEERLSAVEAMLHERSSNGRLALAL